MSLINKNKVETNQNQDDPPSWSPLFNEIRFSNQCLSRVFTRVTSRKQQNLISWNSIGSETELWRHLDSMDNFHHGISFQRDPKQMRNKTRILSFRVTSPLTSLTANAHILSTATAFNQGLSFIGHRPRDT